MRRGDPLAVRHKLAVRDAATVLCVRRRRRRRDGANGGKVEGAQAITRADLGDAAPRFFGDSSSRETFYFTSNWEVLLGQAEVVNWMRSSKEKLVSMRYAGEWKIPGGEVDEGETLEQAALRELTEEIGFPVPTSTLLRPLCAFQTRPVRSKSHMMHTFVAIEDENEWMSTLDVDALNKALGAKRMRFKALVEKGGFFDLPKEAKELLSPEVHEVKWVPLRDAVYFSLTSLIPGTFNSEYQARMFRTLSMSRGRDPMWITAATLMELEAHPSKHSIVASSRGMDMRRMGKEKQWLRDGMTHEEVQQEFIRRTASGVKRSLRTLDEIEALRAERMAHL